MHVRQQVRRGVAGTTSPAAAVGALGGCERACTLAALASLDTDGNGKLSKDEYERYVTVGGALVESTKNFHLNAGVVAALVLSVVYGLAYEENESLASLASKESWRDMATVADLTSFLAMQLAVATSFLTVLVSSRLYTQLAFWMPNLDSQLWFIDASATMSGHLESFKNLTLFSTLLALSLETAVTATWLDLVAFLPLALLGLFYAHLELSLSRRVRDRLGHELARIVPSTPPSAAVHRLPPPAYTPSDAMHAPAPTQTPTRDQWAMWAEYQGRGENGLGAAHARAHTRGREYVSVRA